MSESTVILEVEGKQLQWIIEVDPLGHIKCSFDRYYVLEGFLDREYVMSAFMGFLDEMCSIIKKELVKFAKKYIKKV